MTALSRRHLTTKSRPQRIGLAVLLLACLFSTAAAGSQLPAPRLSTSGDVVTAGYYRLSWETASSEVESVTAPLKESIWTPVWELQEATQADFRDAVTAYRGPDSATVFSGKPDGARHYRLRSVAPQASPWSDTVSVRVTHHSLSRALLFLSLGIVVFVATVVLIVRGPEAAK
ncbi:MAG: fibronectin type III domain-containing protein [Gammaproteobacteria bacterium]|nr:fibronectin type III domain-containing protein [Gammaproteobacteria bacterium]